MDLWLTVADVARRLNAMPDAVRDLERRGRLKAVRTAGGMRLFALSEVERFIEERKRHDALQARR